MSKVTIKAETEEALFSAKRLSQRSKRGDYDRERDRRWSNQKGHKSNSEDEEDSDKEEYRQRQHRLPKRGECFICGHKGHYARECKWLKKIQNNFAKIDHKNEESEEEWDFEATYAVEEDVPKEKEWNFEETYAVEEDATEEQEWDLSEENGELWIEDLEGDDNIKIAASSIVAEEVNDQHGDEETTKMEGNDQNSRKEIYSGLVLGHKEMELVATQLGAIDVSVIKYKDTGKELAWQGVQKQGELSENIQTLVLQDNIQGSHKNTSKVTKKTEDDQKIGDYPRSSRKIKNHSRVDKNYSQQLKNQERLTEETRVDQVKHEEFDIGANIKRPPDREEQLGIEGEY